MDVRSVALVTSLGSLVVGAAVLGPLGSAAGAANRATNDAAQGTGTEIVSLTSDEELGNSSSGDVSVSRGARVVAFQSNASNLVPDDTNLANDVFVRDRAAGTTERVSVSSSGVQANGLSFGTAISADGRYVAFTSHAGNLVPGDTNGMSDAFIHDRNTGTTTLVTVDQAGGPSDGPTAFGLDLSADGRFVAFTSLANDLTADGSTDHAEVYVRDLLLGETERVSVARDGGSSDRRSQSEPSISADGRFVAFESSATNLVRGDGNDTRDVFVRDRETSRTVLVSRGRDGTSSAGTSRLPDISADGRHISFTSTAGNLVRRDTNEAEDVFVHNLVGGAMRRVSLLSDGTQAHPVIGTQVKSAISVHGRYVAFSYMAPLVDEVTGEQQRAYLWDRASRSLELVSVNDAGAPATAGVGLDDISPHGRHVAFFGNGGNLTPSPTDPPQAYLRVRGS